MNAPIANNDAIDSLPARRPTEIDKAIGMRIRMRRSMLEMSQEQLATACKVSAQQIHKYERGHSSIRASRLIQIGKVLQTPVAFFYSEVDEQNSMPRDLLDLLSDPTCVRALLAFRQIKSEEDRQKLVDVIKVFAGEDDVAAGPRTAQSA